jgi:DNA-binding FadR family transcriptional regulator
MKKDPQQIRRRRLYEEVEERLEEDIRRGRLKPGDLLPSERELMRHFGVGRPAIREAMLSLQRKGLLRVGAGERSRVTRPTFDAVVNQLSGAVSQMLAEPMGLKHMQHARIVFEGALAREAARLATAEEIAALKAALDKNHAELGDPLEFEKSDVDFHYAIATAAHNPIFTALHQALLGWLIEQRTMSLAQPEAAMRALRYHGRIFEAIRDRDGGRAEAEMQAHLTEVAEFYWATLEKYSRKSASRKSAKPRSPAALRGAGS